MANAGNTSIVKLNIGGVIYVTTAATLTKSSQPSFFSALLSGKVGTTKDENGAIFIDRAGEFFKPILEFLRTGELDVPSSMNPHHLRREAEYYSLVDVVQAIDLQNQEKEAARLSVRFASEGFYWTQSPPPSDIPAGSIAFVDKSTAIYTAFETAPYAEGLPPNQKSQLPPFAEILPLRVHAEKLSIAHSKQTVLCKYVINAKGTITFGFPTGSISGMLHAGQLWLFYFSGFGKTDNIYRYQFCNQPLNLDPL